MHLDLPWFNGAVKTRYINKNFKIGKLPLGDLNKLLEGEQKTDLMLVLGELFDFGVGIGLQPDPSQISLNIEIVRPNDDRIMQRIWLKGDNLATLWRGDKFNADGIILDHHARERNMGYIIFTAGVHTLLIYSEEVDKLVVIRILFKHLMELSGIIEKAVNEFPKRVVSKLQAAICLGQRNYFLKSDHPDTAERLEVLREKYPTAVKDDGRREEATLIIPTLIELRLRDCGVQGNISYDKIDTATDKINDEKWHSTPEGGRNAVIVKLV